MRKIITLIFICLIGSFNSWGQELRQPVMALLSEGTNTTQRQVVWSTDPGIRYELQESMDLETWTPIDDFPAEATALAQQHLIETEGSPNRFFQVQALDEQPPRIVYSSPEDGDFGVRRFSAIIIELSDATGIDPASISLTLGSNGTFDVSSPQMAFATNSIMLDLGGDTALGGYGETQEVTLAVADTLANATNYVWQFELETELIAASNLFIFGSPDAQRAGQRLIGTAAALASRFGGPVSMSSTTQEWEIASVTSNEITLVYNGTNAPVFSVGQPLANLAPTHVSEIFYRRIDEIVDDPTNKVLTLQTTEITMPDILDEGSFTIGEDAVYLEVDDNGNLIPALGFDGSLPLPTIGTDLTNEVLWVSGPLSLTLEEAKFLFHSKFKAVLKTGSGTVKRFSAEPSGKVEISCIPVLSLSEAYTNNVEKELWSKSHWIWTLAGGWLPVGIELTASVTANASLEVGASAELRTGFRQTANMRVTGEYKRNADAAFTFGRKFDADPIEKVRFTYTLDGNGELIFSLVPQIDVRVYGAAGLYLNTDPRLELSGSATMVNMELTEASWKLGAYADANVGLSVVGFDTESLPSLPPFRLFTKEWGDYYPEPDPDAPPVITIQPFSQNARVGDTVTLFVEATGASTWQWFQNGEVIPGATGSALTLRDVKSDYHVGKYQVRVGNSNASVDSDTVQFGVVTSGQTGVPIGGMARIPGGTNSGTDADFGFYSLTVEPFYMDRTGVTKAQWDTVYSWAVAHGYGFDNSGSGKAANHPVHTVSWYDCVKWCNARSEMEGRTPCYTVGDSIYKTGRIAPGCNLDANGYRLPTAEEWEYAARGGLSGKRFPWGDTITHNEANYASYSYNSWDISFTRGYHPAYVTEGDPYFDPYTSPVGSFPANGYGLYDMSGNLWEWCWDRFVRGGAWDSVAGMCGGGSSANPIAGGSNRGFRTVRR